jgi:hypothetical protein
MEHKLTIKWGKSRAKGKEDMTTCACWMYGKRQALVVGSGFDLRGAAFGELLGVAFGKRILKYATDNPLAFNRRDEVTDKTIFTPIVNFFPGVRVHVKNDEITWVQINGEIGFGEMVKFAEKLGVEVWLVNETGTADTYKLIDNHGE